MLTKHLPWTHEQIQALLPKLEKSLKETEASQEEEVRGLPAMTKEEAKDYIFRIMDYAAERPLTQREIFIHGQLLCCFEMAVMAETLGKKGRYFVVSEEHINKLMQQHEAP